MSSIKCNICNFQCGVFFIWSSTRNFPRERLIKVYGRSSQVNRKNMKEGIRVCFGCIESLEEDE